MTRADDDFGGSDEVGAPPSPLCGWGTPTRLRGEWRL